MKEHSESAKQVVGQWQTTCSTEIKLKEGLLVGCGNPLVDMIVSTDNERLKKFRTEPHEVKFAEPRHQQLFEDVDSMPSVKYVAAGSVHNAMRVFQWILQKPFLSAYLGCVGNDENGRFLAEQARMDGINARLQYTDAAMTGRCSVLLTPQDNRRARIMEPGAAAHFSVKHLHKYTNRKLIEGAKFHYMASYFLHSNREAAIELAQLTHQLSTTFIFKLGPKEIVAACREDLKALMPYVDVLVCGETGLRCFGASFGWERKLKILGQNVFMLPKKNPQRQRIVVILRSLKPVMVVTEDSIREYPVPDVTPVRFHDTNGACDAFIGAFLSQLVQGKEISACVLWGIWAAKTVVQRLGCTFEGDPIMSNFWLDHYMKNALGAGIHSPHVRTSAGQEIRSGYLHKLSKQNQ